MKISFNLILLLIITAFVLAGCSTTERKSDPICKYKAKHPNESKGYVYINAISLDTYYYLASESLAQQSIGARLKAQFKNVPGMNDFADETIEEFHETRREIFGMFKKLEDTSSNGGVICQYKWNDGNTDEIGFLVIKSGEIVEKETLVTEFLKEKKPLIKTTQ